MTRNELLRTIEILFWEQSFSDLSMDAIAKKLDMKKASLYYHFPSKESMFLAVLEYSYETYKKKYQSILGMDNLQESIQEMITFPYREKNLFSIVSQKWYCQIQEIEIWMREKNTTIQNQVCIVYSEKYNWNTVRNMLFFSLIDGLAKRCCREQCEQKDLELVLSEIIELFFV